MGTLYAETRKIPVRHQGDIRTISGIYQDGIGKETEEKFIIDKARSKIQG